MAAQREWFEKDYYKVLGIKSDAPDKEITKAYRKLAKQHHPHANQGNASAEAKFKEVSAAYDVLGDPAKRKEYDEVRRMASARVGSGGGNPFAGAGAGGAAGNFKFEDLSDIFGGLFNRGNPGGATHTRSAGATRGDDVTAELKLSFDQAVNGVTTTVNVTTDVQCERCHGSMAEPGTSAVSCSACKGTGLTEDNQGVFSFSRPCTSCGGSGKRIEKPCKSCRGTGLQRKNRQVKVRIPVGVKDGQQIRLAGRGGAGRGGGTSGDLFVRVRVTPHKLFGRNGNDLLITVPVTYPELVLGTTVKVPTLNGSVTLKVPPATQPGKVLRVKGKGVATTSSAGDLLVTVELDVSKNPSGEERKLIEQLAKVVDASMLRKHLGVD